MLSVFAAQRKVLTYDDDAKWKISLISLATLPSTDSGGDEKYHPRQHRRDHRFGDEFFKKKLTQTPSPTESDQIIGTHLSGWIFLNG